METYLEKFSLKDSIGSFFLSSHCNSVIFKVKDESEYNALLSTFEKYCKLRNFKTFYEPISRLGSGSYAKVYSCKKNSDNNIYAVKVYDKEIALKKDSHKESLSKEIRSLKNFCHPNILRIYETYEGERHVYMVMENLKGGDIYGRLKKVEKFTEEKAAYIIYQILSALNYIHKRGYMHRDLKPANILFNDDEGFFLKIIDFGFVEKIDEEFSIKRCGTAGYLAPEIFGKDKYDSKVDIFSVGIILTIILTGKHPMKKATVKETLEYNKTLTDKSDYID